MKAVQQTVIITVVRNEERDQWLVQMFDDLYIDGW